MSAGISYGFPGSRDRSNLRDTNPYAAVKFRSYSLISVFAGRRRRLSQKKSTLCPADAMLVFGAGALAGLTSAFFAYVGRTFRIERPYLASWRRPLRWLAILAAIAGAICFIGALNMARVAVLPKEAPAAPSTGVTTETQQ
jgi:hypothetical protein